MKARAGFRLVLVTCPDAKTARGLAQAALRARLIACANLVPGIESLYRWKGKIEKGREVLMLIKTTAARLASLERLILEKHPYDTPEFLVLPINRGTQKYLTWLSECVR